MKSRRKGTLLLILLLISFFWLSFIPNCFAATANIIRVHGADKGSNTGTTTTLTVPVTLANSPLAGNVLVATCSSDGQGANNPVVSSITESGVAWSKIVSAAQGASAYPNSEVWIGVVASGASTSVSVNFVNASAGNYNVGIVNICEYSGVAVTSYTDKTVNTAVWDTGTTTSTGTTATTTQNEELWIGVVHAQQLSGTGLSLSTPTNGFALLDGVGVDWNGGASTDCQGFLEKIVSSTGTASSGATASASSKGSGCMVTLKAATLVYPYIQKISNVDSTTDIGTHSNFTAQQYGPDLVNDTLTEGNSGTTTDAFTDGFETDLTKWDGNGATTWSRSTTQKHTGSYSVQCNSTQDGSLTSDDINMTSIEQIGVSFWIYDHLLDNADGYLNLYNGSAYVQIIDLNTITGATEDTWIYYSYVTTSTQYMVSNFRVQFTETPETNEICYIDDVTVNATVANYKLALEEQFTNATYTDSTEELCIYAGPFSSAEVLTVQAWNGSTWQYVMNLTANQWNNASITTWLTSSDLYIQFVDGTQTSDTAQSNWQIDACLIYTASAAGILNYYLSASLSLSSGAIHSSISFNHSAATSITFNEKTTDSDKSVSKQSAQALTLLENKSSTTSFSRSSTEALALLDGAVKAFVFNRSGSALILFDSVASYLFSIAKNFFGSALLSLLGAKESSFSFLKENVASLLLSANRTSSFTFLLFSSAQLLFSSVASYFAVTAKTLLMFGSSMLSLLVNRTSSWTFLLFSTANLTLDIVRSSVLAVAKEAVGLLSMLGSRSSVWSFSRFGSAELVLTLAGSLSASIAGVLLMFGSALLMLFGNETHTFVFGVSGFASLVLNGGGFTIIGVFLNVFGSAVIALNEKVTYAFTKLLSGAGELLLNVSSTFSYVATGMFIFGSALLSVFDRSLFSFTQVMTNEDWIVVGAVFGGVIIGALALSMFIALRKKDEDYN